MTEPFGVYRLRSELRDIEDQIERLDARGEPIPPRLERLVESKRIALAALEKLSVKPRRTA